MADDEVMSLSRHEADLFEDSRARLEAIAYRLLGSATDAEDAVQDTFLRWHGADREQIEVPEAWLTKVLTNLCLNHLTSARARRETYVGQWLPEPLMAGDRMLGPSDTVEQRESVSMAMLTLLERLSPNERAVYVLREAFEYPHRDIADILELSESNCQQIYRRAKQHVATDRPRIEVDAVAAHTIAEQFLAAALSGDTEPLVQLLTDDAMSVADGGGHVPARKTPITGAVGIARFLRGVLQPTDSKRALVGGTPIFYSTVANGEPAVLVEVDGQILGLLSLRLTPDGVAAIHTQVNPEKLERLAREWAGAGPQRAIETNW